MKSYLQCTTLLILCFFWSQGKAGPWDPPPLGLLRGFLETCRDVDEFSDRLLASTSTHRDDEAAACRIHPCANHTQVPVVANTLLSPVYQLHPTPKFALRRGGPIATTPNSCRIHPCKSHTQLQDTPQLRRFGVLFFPRVNTVLGVGLCNASFMGLRAARLNPAAYSGARDESIQRLAFLVISKNRSNLAPEEWSQD